MNVETMPAGREMDALVAEKVMGLNLKGSELFFVTHLQEWWFVSGPLSNTRLERYSTDIAAAWEILHKLYRRVLFKELVIRRFAEGDGWEVSIDRGAYVASVSGSSLNWEGVADAAPLAICRAALKIVL